MNLHKVKNTALLVLAGCALATQAFSQADNSLALADKYFASGDYFTAAGLYEQYLHPVKKQTSSDFPLHKNSKGGAGKANYVNDLAIEFKQAESYRLANYWNEAAVLYKECYAKDPATYPNALYWYAICQRSLGNFTAAQESLDQFIAGNPGTAYMEEAAKEKDRLHFISQQLVRPDSILYHLQKVSISSGSETGVYAPGTAGGDQLLVTSTIKDSVALPGVNPYHNRLFQGVWENGSLQNLSPVTIEGNDNSLNQGTAMLSPDGNTIYFTQWKKENGNSLSAIYTSTKKENGWSQPSLLASVNQEGSNSKQPFCTADGKYLFFASDRKGGSGGFDIWYAPLQANGQAGEPVNAGTVINTAGNEQAPFYHTASNTLVYSSDNMPGMGGYDLFAAKGKETNWQAPENMGNPINSPRDDIYYYASEKGSIHNNALFSSDRGSECCLSTYTVTKTPKRKLISGIVRDCKDDTPLAGTEVVMKETSGKTYSVTTGGDGSYVFELSGDINQRQFLVSKEKYAGKTAEMEVDGGKTGWLIDTIYNAPLCLEKKLVIKVENVVTLYFDFDQSALRDRATQQLDSIYNVLVENPKATIQVSGYTDGLGSVEYNKKLSDKRAKSCADYLIAKGIDASRISFESFGACCPVEMEMINGRDNPDGRSMNRRALINIDKGAQE
ncbi:MAG TPA: OmpA family protein [Flavisolibacter sp.]|nr:OmpA family protein [Flavisolibacter sp.]